MKELFVSYELAKQLKEKGFDEICLATYNGGLLKIRGEILRIFEDALPAPIYQQVIDWFREKHNIVIEARLLDDLNWWDTMAWNENMNRLFRIPGYKTYYEALNAAIEETLKITFKDGK